MVYLGWLVVCLDTKRSLYNTLRSQVVTVNKYGKKKKMSKKEKIGLNTLGIYITFITLTNYYIVNDIFSS